VQARSDVRSAVHRSPALGVHLDVGHWHDDRRVLLPLRCTVDGRAAHVRFPDGGAIDCTAPRPVSYFEIPVETPEAVKAIQLESAIVQIRGPWLIPFERQ